MCPNDGKIGTEIWDQLCVPMTAKLELGFGTNYVSQLRENWNWDLGPIMCINIGKIPYSYQLDLGLIMCPNVGKILYSYHCDLWPIMCPNVWKIPHSYHSNLGTIICPNVGKISNVVIMLVQQCISLIAFNIQI